MAKKRKLNKKLVGLLVGGFVGLCALGCVAYKFKGRFFKENPEKYLALGRAALADKNYVVARDNLSRAAGLLRTPDASLYVMIGEALNGLTSKDPDNVTLARQLWEQANGLDPTYAPALEHLVQYWKDELDLQSQATPRAKVAEQLYKTAKKLTDVDKDNRLGRAMGAEAMIDALVDGIQKDPQDIKDAQDTLIDLAAKDPSDADLPYMLARSYLWQGQEAGRNDDPKEQQRCFALCEQVMRDAERIQPKNAYLHFRTGQLLLLLSVSNRVGSEQSARSRTLIGQGIGEVDEAKREAQSDDPHYLDINLYDARLVLERPTYAPATTSSHDNSADPSLSPAALTAQSLSGSGAAPRADRLPIAEGIYRKVLLQHPNDPATKLALAELLGDLMGRRQEAITMLSQPFVDVDPHPGVKGTLTPAYQAQADLKLLSLKLDQLEAMRDTASRTPLLAECDVLRDRLYNKTPDSPSVLGLKGRLELQHNRVIDATQTLRRALTLMNPQDVASQRSRYDLMFTLAKACMVAQQTGEAKRLAGEVASQYPHFIPARLLMARLLIGEHSFDEARPHVDFLESIAGGSPQLSLQVVRLRLASLDPQKEPDRVKFYYDKMPENNRDELLDKAGFARLLKNDDDAIRLASLAHKQSPGDVTAASTLAGLYLAQGKKPEAQKVVDESIAANPGDPTLLAFQMQMAGPPSATNPSQATVSAPTAPTSIDEELAAAEVARSRDDVNGVQQHLAAAEKINPNDPRVWDQSFRFDLATRNWDRASFYLDKLATNNSDHAGGLLYRVQYSLARGDMQKASAQALELTRQKPEFAQTWCMLGKVQQASGKYDDAITNYQQALNLQTQNMDALHGLVDCYYALGKTDEAKHVIDEGRKIAPNNELFKSLEFNYVLTYGDPQTVIAPRIAAAQAAPENPQNWMNLAGAYVAAAKAPALAKDPNAVQAFYVNAADALLHAATRYPDDPSYTFYYAKTALAAGEFPAAEKAMLALNERDALKGRPDTAGKLAEFYDLAGQPEVAVKVLRDYLAHPFQPTDAAADLNVTLRLSDSLSRLHRPDDAMAVLPANSSNLLVVRQRAVLLGDNGRRADAIKVLDDAAAVKPLTPSLLNLKGLMLLDSARLADASQAFNKVLEAEPENIFALSHRAQVTMRASSPDYASALSDLTRARDLAPDDANIRIQLADLDKRRGQFDEGAKETEAAVRVAPANKRVRLYQIYFYANNDPPQWSDADRAVREAEELPLFSDDPDLIHAQAHIALGRGDLSKAQDLIKAAMDKSPSDLGIIRTYYDILLKAKSFSQLIAHSDQLLASRSDASSLWWIHIYRAQARMRGTGDRTGASAEFEQAIAGAKTANDDNASQQIVFAMTTELGLDGALKIALAHAQTDNHWGVLAAGISRDKGDNEVEISSLEKALAQFDTLSVNDQDLALRLVAAAYLAETPPDMNKAADAYKRLLQKYPDDIGSLNNLACLLVEPGPANQPKEALEYGERAYNQMLKAGMDEPLIKDTYGWTLIANGRNDEGLSLVQEALGKKDFVEAHYHLAEGLLRKQPPSADDAAAELYKAMQMFNDAERDGKPVDETLKAHVQDLLKKTKSGLNG